MVKFALHAAGGRDERRQRLSQDLVALGKMLPRLWISIGAAFFLWSLGSHGFDRLATMAISGPAVLFGVSTLRTNWPKVPIALVRLMPLLAAATMTVQGWLVPETGWLTLVSASAVLLWTGVILELRDLLGAMLASLVLCAVPIWRSSADPVAAAWRTAGACVSITAVGFAMYWLRRRLEQSHHEILLAQRQADEATTRSAIAREHAEQQRAAATATELGERVRLQRRIASESAALAAAAAQVRLQAGSAVSASDEMSSAVDDLARNAQVTEEITTSVAASATQASELMSALESASAQIMTASDVIHRIAEQTSLLALNATIESARAGEAGHGFAVVANEVKDLSHQTGENADAITRTLGEVQARVTAAAARVAEITARTGELSSHHNALAAALSQQSTSVRQIVASVQETASQVGHITDRTEALEQLSR